MAATVTCRVYTGSGAGTESAAQDQIALLSIDSASYDPTDGEVAPGTNSFEKWMRLKVDDADGTSVSDFWIERAGDLPDGVIIKMGVTDAPATPTATTSTVATTTMVDGRRYFFDMGSYDADNDATRYLVLQEQVAADADDGSIDTQSFQWGWSEQ